MIECNTVSCKGFSKICTISDTKTEWNCEQDSDDDNSKFVMKSNDILRHKLVKELFSSFSNCSKTLIAFSLERDYCGDKGLISILSKKNQFNKTQICFLINDDTTRSVEVDTFMKLKLIRAHKTTWSFRSFRSHTKTHWCMLISFLAWSVKS